jgi:hypothetical protein
MKLLSITGLLVLVLATGAYAQSTGSITGHVTDESGAAMPGATVTVTNTGTGVARETVTNTVGLYSVQALQPGSYDVKVALSGFAARERKGVQVATGADASVDVTLGLAAVNESVTVTGEAPLVDTSQSTPAAQLQVEQVQNLPLINRNFQGLIQLLPGARPSVPVNSTRNAFGYGISVAGGTGRNVGIVLDGAENRDQMVGGPAQNYTVEGIQEFRVMTYQFGAQYGRTNGAIVQVTTKSGTNTLHGGGFFFGRNDALTAKNYFTKQTNSAKPAYDRQQYGGSLGGPIIGNKLFYFGAIERIQQDSSISVNAKAYSEGLALKAALPQLNLNPVTAIPQPVRDTMYTLKFDYQAANSHGLFLRVAQQFLDADNDQSNATRGDYGPGANNKDKNRLYTVVGSHNWIISNTAVNTLMFQRADFSTKILCDCGPQGEYWVTRNLTFPSVGVGRVNNTTDQSFYQDKITLKDDYSIQLSKHALKIGGDYSWFPQLGFELTAGCNCTGNTTFFDDPTTILNDKTKYPQGFLTPGAVRRIDLGTPLYGGPPGQTFSIGQKEMSAYVQDDITLSSRLTVNVGLRYDLLLNGYNQNEIANNRAYNALKAIGHPLGQSLPKTPTTDISPRGGFAWNITGDGRNVLRASGGLLYDQFLHVLNFTAAQQNKEILQISSFYQNTAIGVGQLPTYVYGVSPLPPGPGARPTALPRGANAAGTFISPDIKDTRTATAHVGFVREIASRTALSADFSYVKGYNGTRFTEVNPIEGPWDPKALPSQYGRRRLADQFGQVLGDPAILGSVIMIESNNKSTFKELTLQIQHRAERANLQASYTLSDAKAFGGVFGAGYGGGGGAQAQNPDDPFGPGEWAPVANDERHRLVLSGVFELPWGIQAAPVLQAGSARPYNLVCGRDCNGDGQGSFYSKDQWVNPATGKAEPINSARGEPTFNIDARFTKFFDFGAGRRVGAFAEIYNLTNRANFGSTFSGNALAATFRQPTGFAPGLPQSRQAQVGVRYIF